MALINVKFVPSVAPKSSDPVVAVLVLGAHTPKAVALRVTFVDELVRF